MRVVTRHRQVPVPLLAGTLAAWLIVGNLAVVCHGHDGSVAVEPTHIAVAADTDDCVHCDDRIQGEAHPHHHHGGCMDVPAIGNAVASRGTHDVVAYVAAVGPDVAIGSHVAPVVHPPVSNAPPPPTTRLVQSTVLLI